MHPITFNNFADAPTLLLVPQHHPFYRASSAAHTRISPSAHTYRYQSFVPIMSSTPPKPSEGSIQSTPPSKDTPSKKRRRELAPLDTNLDGNDDVEMGMGMAMPPSNTPAVSPQQGAGVVPQSNLQPYRQLPSTGQWKSSHVNSIDEMLHASGSKKPISEESEVCIVRISAALYIPDSICLGFLPRHCCVFQSSLP